MPDYTALDAALEEATTLKDTVKTSTDGTEVPSNEKWMTAADKATLEAAITAAGGEKSNPTAKDQDGVEVFTKALTDAIALAQPGTKFVPDYTALNAEIAKANTAKTGVLVSTDGKDIAIGTKWVLKADMDTLNAAIKAAQDMVDGDTATSAGDITTAVNTLKSAVTSFESAKNNGLKPSFTDIVKPGAGLSIKNGQLLGFKADPTKGTSLASLRAMLNLPENYDLQVMNGDIPVTSGNVGTGMLARIIDNSPTVYNESLASNVVDTVTVVIAGDLNGDSLATVTDFVKLAEHVRNIKSLAGAYLTAGDMNNDGSATVTDFVLLAEVIRAAS